MFNDANGFGPNDQADGDAPPLFDEPPIEAYDQPPRSGPSGCERCARRARKERPERPAPKVLWTVEDYIAAAASIKSVDITTQTGNQLRLGAGSEMTLLWGPSSAGKSWLAMWMAERLAAQNVRSLFLLTEGQPDFLERSIKYPWPNGLTPGIIGIGRNDLKPKYRAHLMEAADQVGAIFLDVVSALFSDHSENDSQAWNSTRHLLNPIIGNRLFIAVHHTGHPRQGDKPGDWPRSPRGTTRLLDDAAYDFVMKPWGDFGAKMKPGKKSRGKPKAGRNEMWFRFPEDEHDGVTEANTGGGDRNSIYDPQ